ncbi:hypothetical protein B0T10DRAFT_545018 [Thelonectria olida]|uniref:Uncharacterized protein n=1 Tax=Thelonectria olida TaxID=1576542 RepID=A0A9P9AW30_9HYPO|nr:hypothetical protein B0T10DRAFT_545018 [Thelonectria olida]
MPVPDSVTQLSQGDSPDDALPRSKTRSRIVSVPGEVQQTSSLGGWVKAILPSHRPERGGTIRQQGFWTNHKLDTSIGTQQTGSDVQRGHRRENTDTVDSGHIAEWNIPQEVDKIELKSSTTRSRPRAVSAGTSSLHSDVDRKWSWVPRDDAEYWTMYKTLGKRRDPEKAVEATSRPPLSPVTKTLLSLQGKREARKERRSLKESGDYLGVQGFNPSTGVPDVMTPSDSDHSATGQEVEEKLDALKQLSKDASSPSSKKRIDKEIRKVLLEKEGDKFARREEAKAALQRAHSNIRWRKHSKQWSSAQVPDLSPIAQSQTSNTPPLRRESRLVSAGHREGELIDLSLPESEQKEMQTLGPVALHMEPYQAASGSSGTVVQTPIKQSRAGPSPSAVELFENGISFDNLNQSHGNTGLESPTLHPEITAIGLDGPKRSKRESFFRRQLKPPGLPALKIIPPSNPATPSNNKPSHHNSSFLARRNPSRERLTETSTNPKLGLTPSSSSLQSLSTLFKATPPTQAPRLASKKQRSRVLPFSTSTQPRQIEHDLRIHRGRSAIPQSYQALQRVFGPLAQSFQQESQSTPTPKSSLNKLGQDPYLNIHRGAKISQRHHRTKNNCPKPGVLGLDGATDRTPERTPKWIKTSSPDQKSLEKKAESELPLTEQEIQDEIRRVRKTLALIDQPTLTTVPNRAHSESTQSWAQDAINDITSKCKEIVEESAFTPIITTTGFGQATSRFNQSLERSLSTAHYRRQLNRVIYNVQDPDPTVDSLGSSPRNPLTNHSQDLERPKNHHRSQFSRLIYNAQGESSPIDSPVSSLVNPLLSTPPSSEPQVETPSTGFMSVRDLSPTKQIAEPLATKGLGDRNPGSAICLTQRSTSRTSTSTIIQEESEKSSEDETMANPLEKRVMDAIGRRGGSQGTHNELHRESGTFLKTKMETGLEARIPGSYPAHLGDGDGTAGHSNARHREPGGLWKAVKEVFSTIKFCVVWMIKAYWHVIRPVFDSRQEVKWLDLMRLAMAMPVFAVMLMGMVWGMKLVAVAVTCVRNGSEAAWDELIMQLQA